MRGPPAVEEDFEPALPLSRAPKCPPQQAGDSGTPRYELIKTIHQSSCRGDATCRETSSPQPLGFTKCRKSQTLACLHRRMMKPRTALREACLARAAAAPRLGRLDSTARRLNQTRVYVSSRGHDGLGAKLFSAGGFSTVDGRQATTGPDRTRHSGWMTEDKSRQARAATGGAP